jgi:hypothetical protein
MYTSLDRIDIVTKANESGRAGYVLTDHRSVADVESEPELSVLYALTRVRAAASMGAREGGADVLYACATAPPAFLHEAVVSAGGRLTVTDGALPPADPPARPVADLADAAFRGLAERIRQGATMDEALLTRLEDETLKDPPNKENDEGRYWARVHELAAVCGEVLRAKIGGRWMLASESDRLLPFVFSMGDGHFNVSTKAQRLVDGNESHRLTRMVHGAADIARKEEGPLMLNLRSSNFPGEKPVSRELLAGSGAAGARLPLVFLGRDQPNSFAYLPAGAPDVDKSFAEALQNLARLELPAEPRDLAGIKVLVVSGHYYASEKILDQAFMLTLHRRLGAEMLAAAIPHKGLLLVTGEVLPPGIAKFAAIAETLHANSKGAPPLSPIVLLVTGGTIVGRLEPGAKAAEPPPKTGLWGRLLGHN